MIRMFKATAGFMLLIVISIGCGFTAENAPSAKLTQSGDYRFSIRVGKLNRKYTVHVPSGYTGTTSIPVVIMLHGGGATSRAAIYETGWIEKADKEGFVAVFPDAMPPDPSRPSHFVRNPQLWNDGSDRFYTGQKTVDDVGFIEAMLNDLLARLPVNANKIYISGFSNGASMCFLAGSKLSNRIAAIAPVAGANWLSTVSLKRPVSLLYITGNADPLNPIKGGIPKLATGVIDTIRAKPKPPVRESIAKWAKALGCPVNLTSISEKKGVRTVIYRPCREGTEVVNITVDGLGHTWAGGRSLLPEIMVGKQSDKINATEVIWDFFNKHSLLSR